MFHHHCASKTANPYKPCMWAIAIGNHYVISLLFISFLPLFFAFNVFLNNSLVVIGEFSGLARLN